MGDLIYPPYIVQSRKSNQLNNESKTVYFAMVREINQISSWQHFISMGNNYLNVICFYNLVLKYQNAVKGKNPIES